MQASILAVQQFIRDGYAAAREPSYVCRRAGSLFALMTRSAAYFMREVRRSLTHPIMEIAIGLAASAQAVSPASGDLARLVALLAGIRIITDGIVRFFKLTKLRAASCDPTPSPDQ
jgi:hypothetical protein